MEKVSNYNKVNFISVSRILLTVIGVLLIFSGNIKLLVIAYLIMGFSEVTDVIDGYVARREKLVTDLGKILDPLSDSISRFFYFFALAYHGLFPIWFMVFFFFRDIIVAYLRIYVSFTGTVLSARLTGKVKGAAQFAGQYLLMISLMINTINDGQQISTEFIMYATGIALFLYIMSLIIFKIKGALLYLVVILSVVLTVILVFMNRIDYHVNYLTTFIISFVTLGVTLFSLVDYLMSLDKNSGNTRRIISCVLLVSFMFLISPYFLDLVKNKVESDVELKSWDKLYQLEVSDQKIVFEGMVQVDDYLLASGLDKGGECHLFIYSLKDEIPKFITELTNLSGIEKITDMEYNGQYLYLVDAKQKIIIEADFYESLATHKLVERKRLSTGFLSGGTVAVTGFNGRRYLMINDNIFSNNLYFFDTDRIDVNKKLKDQIAFKLKSELYIDDISCANGKLYMLASKLGHDLVYRVDLERAIFGGSIQTGIEQIVNSPQWNIDNFGLFDKGVVVCGEDCKSLYWYGGL